MINKPVDIVCSICGATITPHRLPWKDEWRFFGCGVCAAREQAEIKRLEILTSIDGQLSKIDDILLKRGVGQRHIHASVNDFPPAYRTLHTGCKGLFVYGPRGTGKTYLMAALARATIQDHLNAAREVVQSPNPASYPYMVSSIDLLREIRATFDNDRRETESSIIERYRTHAILILDDLGAEKPTPWALTTLFAIIDARYRDMRRTYVTSNLSLADLSEQTSDRITSRLGEMCRNILMSGADRRLKKYL